MNKTAALLSFVIIALPALAWATPPLPPNKKERVDTLQQQLHDKSAEAEALKKRTKSIESELESTRDKLVRLGHSIQNNETVMESLEERMSALRSEQKSLQDNLEGDRESIARLILALERLRRMPPGAMIARPETPLKTAQSAMLMRDIIPAIHRQAESLRVNLEELDKVSQDLERKKQIARETDSTLKGEYDKLAGLVGKKEELYANTSQDLKKQEEDVRRISKQAKNLQDLVSKLEEERKSKKRTELPPVIGKLYMPLSGVVRTAFNEPDSFGAPSKGISIEGRSGALIVAPMGGIVRFAGPFKGYGNMVILEHEKGYHSLVAGLEKIDTVVGHSVSAGEPLGILHRSENNEKPALYYELRYDGEPVNPAGKFADLG